MPCNTVRQLYIRIQEHVDSLGPTFCYAVKIGNGLLTACTLLLSGGPWTVGLQVRYRRSFDATSVVHTPANTRLAVTRHWLTPGRCVGYCVDLLYSLCLPVACWPIESTKKQASHIHIRIHRILGQFKLHVTWSLTPGLACAETNNWTIECKNKMTEECNAVRITEYRCQMHEAQWPFTMLLLILDFDRHLC